MGTENTYDIKKTEKNTIKVIAKQEMNVCLSLTVTVHFVRSFFFLYYVPCRLSSAVR